MNSESIVYGVIGKPISHSKSPLMMNTAFNELNINAAYAAFPVSEQRLEAAIAGMRALNFGGMNVTIPHKEAVIEYLDELDESAKWIGAVNTIVNRDGKLIGYNTDGIGYARSLVEETGQPLAGKNIVVLGAGGAARGIIYALCKERAQTITVANRTIERANQLAEDFASFGQLHSVGMDKESLSSVMEAADVVINTTSLGMDPHVEATPIDESLLRPGLIASDIVYTPWTTRFLREAELKGCHIHRGLGMFIYQGAFAFEYWTGQKAPVEQMRTVVKQSLSETF